MIFLITTIILFVAIVYFMPKNVSKLDMYVTTLFVTVLHLMTDIVLEFKYGLYGYFEVGVDYKTFLITFFIYPTVNLMFINFFPHQKSFFKKALYIIGFSAFALTYEYISVMVDIFHYYRWKPWYSIPIYPILYLLVIGSLTITRKLQKEI
ncbi:CBO0543 family protein [Ornithinibacillus halophilus]|uniref:Uncharacterized protein n=1 Tax=Ornithinibacillus halophilus TaxID=930117 RepID=A0A1M5IIY2_9BACI|nr:CBO0543 family protein [Ornithinibacillus halophilus]SHG28227.1 hypothetical protein SAMN05216225_102436 [Ornithinibacillus halophilus]